MPPELVPLAVVMALGLGGTHLPPPVPSYPMTVNADEKPLVSQ